MEGNAASSPTRLRWWLNSAVNRMCEGCGISFFSECQAFSGQLHFYPSCLWDLEFETKKSLNTRDFAMWSILLSISLRRKQGKAWLLWGNSKFAVKKITQLLNFFFLCKRSRELGGRLVLAREKGSSPWWGSLPRPSTLTTSCSHYCSFQLLLTAKVQRLPCLPCSWC